MLHIWAHIILNFVLTFIKEIVVKSTVAGKEVGIEKARRRMSWSVNISYIVMNIIVISLIM